MNTSIPNGYFARCRILKSQVFQCEIESQWCLPFSFSSVLVEASIKNEKIKLYFQESP